MTESALSARLELIEEKERSDLGGESGGVSIGRPRMTESAPSARLELIAVQERSDLRGGVRGGLYVHTQDSNTPFFSISLVFYRFFEKCL